MVVLFLELNEINIVRKEVSHLVKRASPNMLLSFRLLDYKLIDA